MLPGPALVEKAILLSHSCVVDKDNTHRVVALIRPMAKLLPAEQENVRGGGKLASFYLPALNEQLPESFIDFRRISTVGLEWLQKGRRITCLCEDARRLMLLRMFAYFTRLELEASVFNVENAEQ